MIRRRGFLAGFAVALAAPAIIRSPGILMPIKPLRLNRIFELPPMKAEGSRVIFDENGIKWISLTVGYAVTYERLRDGLYEAVA